MRAPCFAWNRAVTRCLYHAWTYDLAGNLTGVAFQNGVNGKGGIPADFQMADHSLRRLGPQMAAHFCRVFHKPVQVLGYHHQVMYNNWKLYMENSRDPYHATILHAFYASLKLNRLTMDGGLIVEHDGRHSINYSKGATLDGAMTIFSAGQYHDEVFVRQDQAFFRQRLVIPDSRRIDTLLVIPL